MSSSGKTAIVFGASGISGLAAVSALLSSPAYSRVIAISRRAPLLVLPSSQAHLDKLVHVSLDLLAPTDAAWSHLRSACAANATVALYFAAVYDLDFAADFKTNVSLFRGALELVSAACPRLQRFILQTGYKYWGCHVGPLGGKVASTPFDDDAERHTGENFYFVQEEMLQAMSKLNGWTWTILRPNGVVGWSRGSGMNIVMAIGIYATVKKRLGEPLDFLGNELSWNSIEDQSSAANTAEFCIWIAENDEAANQAFAFHDGDSDACKLSTLWSKTARYFGLALPSPLFRTSEAQRVQPGAVAADTDLATYIADKRPVWAEVCREHGLREEVWDEMNWLYVGGSFSRSWESTATMRKARDLGWDRTIDSSAEHVRVWERMRIEKELPPP